MSEPATKNCRLPSHTVPSHYALQLTPDLPSFTFKGVVTATVNVLEGPVSELKVNAKELSVEKVVADGTNVFESQSYDADVEILTLTFPTALTAGQHTIEFTYTGVISDSMAGFYRSSYVSPSGEKKWMAATQFEATDARMALPCWDEPAFKATFDVSITVVSGLTALSNMPVIREIPSEDGSTKTFVYDRSPIMSTYLLAFVVGELESISDITAEGVQVNVYTTPGKKEEGRFALDVATETLSFFSKYFKTEYPLPKADLIAIPDFAMGAMENWGLVTFRETVLLVNDSKTSAAVRQRVAYVICHELAHQWFGNLVTMKWWSELWLNEGFATWAGWLATEHVFPDWQVWEQFVATETARALATDAMLSTHPVEIPIDDPKLIDQVFDALSYQKGASIIRMLEEFIGKDAFQAGMQLYLQRHKYSNATTVDLWDALGTASSKPVAELMSLWTGAPGYPVVSVDGVGCACQTRFLSSGKATAEQEASWPTWHIPINAVNSAGTKASSVLTVKSDPSALSALVGGDWLKVNVGQAGFYRVNYTIEQWSSLASNLTTLPTLDRLGLVSDAYALFKAGLTPATVPLSLYNNSQSERSVSVWTQITADIADLTNLLSDHPSFGVYQRFLKALYSPIVSTVGWTFNTSDNHVKKLLRVMVLKAASGVDGMDSLVEEAKKLFGQLISDQNSVHAELRDLVMNVAVKGGGEEEYNAVLDIYKGTDHADTRNKCLVALARTRDAGLINRYLDWAVNSGDVKDQDLMFALGGIAANRDGKQLGWEFVKANWTLLANRFANSGVMLSRIATLPSGGFTTHAAADDVEAFFKANPCPAASMGIAQAIETIRARATFIERESASIAEYLASWESKL